jgi:hypothetical protein
MEGQHHSTMESLFKAGMVMVAGWLVAGWMLFLLIASLTLMSGA